MSFRREKYVPKGGPDGGDGGTGGDVVFTASSQRRTLYRFRYQQHYKASSGAHGENCMRYGAKGDDLILEVPVGTLVSNADTGEIIHDFVTDGETVVMARGGRGGKGNKFFASSTNRAPKFAQSGEPGETFRLHLELKLLAEVGIIGFPNAGKSTLIRAISAAKPKIADYPFTTLTPNLGIVHPEWGEPFAVADIPGLIEGAHTGNGLGIKFLRHIERTRFLVHLIDAYDIDPDDPLGRYRAINHELAAYSPILAEKPQVVVLNKMDIPACEVSAELFAAAMGGKKVYRISAATGKGLRDLMRDITTHIEKMREAEHAE